MIFFRKDTLARRCLSVFLMFTSAAVPFHLMAAEAKLGEIGRSAQSFGNMLLQGTELATENSGNLYFQGSSDPISINDLYPSTSGSSSLGADRYFPEEPDVEGAKGYFDSDTEMSKAGSASQKILWQDANSENPTLYGAAYQILLNQKATSKPDFHNDPLMNQTKDVYDNIDVIAKGFGDCTVEDTFTNTDRKIHMPDYKQCEKVNKPVGSCELRHDVSLSVEEIVVNVASRGETYLTVEFDLLAGQWKTIAPSDGYSPVAEIPTLKYEDYCGPSKPKFVVQSGGNFFWNGHGLPGSQDTTAILENIQMPSCENNMKGIVRVTDTKAGNDGGKYILSGGFRLDFIRLESESWSTKECIEKAKVLYDGMCEGGIDVTEGAVNESDCAVVSGVNVCPNTPIHGLLAKSPAPGISNLLISGVVNIESCNFNVGEMDCWTDVHGEVHCPLNEGEILDTCGELEENPSCGYIKSQCILRGESDFCYVQDEQWDCGYKVNVSDIDRETEYKCGGEIKCMGGECIDIESSQNDDFTKAAALLHAAQNMAGDMICAEDEGNTGVDGDGSDGDRAKECVIFQGTPSECKKALGGTVDCCEAPDGVNFADYLSMLTNIPKIDAAIMNVESSSSMVNSIQSGYAYLREPIASTYSQVTGPFTSYIDNITGMVDGVKQVAKDLINQLTEKAQEIMIEALKEVGLGGAVEGGTAAAGGEVLDSAAVEAAKGLGNAIGSVISFIGWVYLIYQVAMLIIQIIYKCTKEELTLGVDRELKKCTFVGSYCASKALGGCIEKREAYCCFPSPLGRIIQEQGRAQLGKNMGTGKAPQCEGLTIEEIGKLDWDRINLDEWVGMLVEHDLFHNSTTVDIDKLTGKGVTLDIEGGNRKNSVERATERAKDAQVDTARQINANRYQVPTGDPSY